MSDDSELLYRYLEDRSEAAFTELVRRHVNLVYRAALRRMQGDAHLAEDVTQAVFVSLSRHAARLKNHPTLAGWLYTAVRNASIDALRKESRRKTREKEMAARWELETSQTVDSRTATELTILVEETLHQLAEGERLAILLRYYDNRPFAEIGRILGRSEDAARMRVDRGLERLQALFAKRGVKSSSGAIAMALGQLSTIAAPEGMAVAVASHAIATTAPLGAGGGLLMLLAAHKAAVMLAFGFMMIVGGKLLYDHAEGSEKEGAIAVSPGESRGIGAGSNPGKQIEGDSGTALVLAPKPTGGVTAGSEAVMPDGDALGREFLAAHPEIRASLEAAGRARVASRYYTFYRALNLSAEQRDEFESLLMSFILSFPGAGGREMTLRIEPNLTYEESDQRLRAILGGAGYEAYRRYNQGNHARRLIAGLASALSESESPLTAVQCEQIQAALGAKPKSQRLRISMPRNIDSFSKSNRPSQVPRAESTPSKFRKR